MLWYLSCFLVEIGPCIIAVPKLPLNPMELITLFTVGLLLRMWLMVSHVALLCLRTHGRNFSWALVLRITLNLLSNWFFFFFLISGNLNHLTVVCFVMAAWWLRDWLDSLSYVACMGILTLPVASSCFSFNNVFLYLDWFLFNFVVYVYL